MNNIFKKLVIWFRANRGTILGVLLILVLGSIYWYFPFASSFYIEPNEITIEQGHNIRLRAFFDPDGKWGPRRMKDVTADTLWKSSNEKVVLIGTAKENNGMIFPSKLGNATIFGSFINTQQEVVVNVTGAKLEATCASPMGNKIFAGEELFYIATYQKIGVPDYRYEWVAPENQKSSEIVPSFIFMESGVKIVKTKITDYAGSSIEIECEPLQVLEQ